MVLCVSPGIVDRNTLSRVHGLTRRFYHFARDAIVFDDGLVDSFHRRKKKKHKKDFDTCHPVHSMVLPNRSRRTSSCQMPSPFPSLCVDPS